MQCAFHPTQTTGVRCHLCNRALCQSCDHRIKGAPYCQECIVAGIEALRRPAYGQAFQQPSFTPTQSSKSPFVAALLAFVPGLGAAYNGQPVKAMCHFLLPVSVWQLASLLNDLTAALVALGGVALYLFSIFDAWRTAQHARVGADIQAEDARIKTWLQAKIHLWGMGLIGIGALTLLDKIAPRLAHRAWPLLLILVGVFFLRDYFKATATAAPATTRLSYRPRPVSFMTTGLTSGLAQPTEADASNLLNAENRFDRWG